MENKFLHGSWNYDLRVLKNLKDRKSDKLKPIYPSFSERNLQIQLNKQKS